MVSMSKLSTKGLFLILLVVASVMILLLSFTNPQNMGLFGILLVLLVIYVFFTTLFYSIYRILGRNKKSDTSDKNRSSNKRPLIISAVLALCPILLITLNSLSSIGLIELALIVLFETVVIFLVIKRT
jgi:heme/copper-type cytochrome/quinol oxidase subunit 2